MNILKTKVSHNQMSELKRVLPPEVLFQNTSDVHLFVKKTNNPEIKGYVHNLVLQQIPNAIELKELEAVDFFYFTKQG